MSIVTLKRKSGIKNSHISKGDNFSLVGGYRNQGWVGQSSIGRHLSRTPFRGPEPMGHGENHGKYLVNAIYNKNNSNNPSIIKSSSINSSNFNKECQYYTAKNFPYNNISTTYDNNSQSTNIDRIINKNMCNIKVKDAGNSAGVGNSCASSTSAHGVSVCNSDTRISYNSKPRLVKNIESFSNNEYIRSKIKPSLFEDNIQTHLKKLHCI